MNKFTLATTLRCAPVFYVKAQTQDAPLKTLFNNPVSTVKDQGKSGSKQYC